MKNFVFGILALCAAVACPVAAAQSDDPDLFIGRVEGYFVRLEPGVYREVYSRATSRELWIEVRSFQIGGDPKRGAMLMIRSSADVERGDLVSFRLGDDNVISIAPIPPENRIVAVAAKRGTLLARLFGGGTDAAF